MPGRSGSRRIWRSGGGSNRPGRSCGGASPALPRFRGVVFRRPALALFQVGLANLGLAGMALAWGLNLGPGVWGFFAGVSFLAGALFALLMLEVLWA